MDYEIVVVGGGPAGLSAALWAADVGLSCALFEADARIGGQLFVTHNPIHNHLGAKFENGNRMAAFLSEQVRDRDIDLRLGSKVVKLDVEDRSCLFESEIGTKRVNFGKIIFATGIRRRELDVPGELEFRGKGILKSGKKQGAEATGFPAAVIGGGDAAFENALILSEFASRVFLIHRRNEFSARKEFTDLVTENEKIEIVTPATVTSFNGDKTLESITLDIQGGSRQIDVNKAVIRIGVQPNSDLLEDVVELDSGGYVVVDKDGRTSSEHVFAVGDLAFPKSMTVSTAIGSGATAVKTISTDKT